MGRYLLIKNIANDAQKKAHLFLYGGNDLEDAYEPLKDINDTYEQIIQKLTDSFNPKINVNLHVHQFREISQFDDETFDLFVNRIRDKQIV